MPRNWDKTRRAFDFLVKRNGTSIDMDEVAQAAGWSAATAATYIRKTWIPAQIVSSEAGGRIVVQLPTRFTWEQFKGIQTQVHAASTVAQTSFEYDIAFSFAGEDREYVRGVAEVLRAYSVQLFYDIYEQHTLWGKDLYAHLDDVYRKRSRYCVMFLSKHYAAKLWTNHERKSAQARAFSESAEYVLPVRLDRTEIPGVPPTTGFLDGTALTPTDVANLVMKKLGIDSGVNELVELFRERLPSYEAWQDGPNLVFYNEREDHQLALSILMLREALRAEQIYLFTESSIFIQ